MGSKKIKSALISVFHKDNLDQLIKVLASNDVQLYSTGGTQKFIEDLGIKVTPVEEITDYPSIFSGRVKTLHPKIFGGILNRRDNESDKQEKSQHNIPDIDLVIVDLYPFEATVASGASEADIIEKIDIGGISLIRGAAKNFNDVLIVSSMEQYAETIDMLSTQDGATTLEQRKRFATKAFDISSHYDSAIFNYFNQGGQENVFKQSIRQASPLRYGENPHQEGAFFGDLDQLFDKLNGKELSYNNLVDVDAAVSLIREFEGETAFAIIKHTNACGVAKGSSVKDAYLKALSSDNISAFGGVLVTNDTVDLAAAEEINKLFCEVLIAPEYDKEALELLSSKKNRVILRIKPLVVAKKQFKTLLNGVIMQDADLKTDMAEDLTVVTKVAPTAEQVEAMLFASKVCKHTKSNTVVFANKDMMLSSGTGQTSRVDALNQAVEKAATFGMDLKGAVMASDAFFPFPDCVEFADKAGVVAVIQPGGSIKDQLSIDYCDEHGMAMVMTGTRHFKH
ncbi:bifunctional phosphoribosylaminoimidazolecarboxamide formyltransferase/IMP cyclohydrolase [Reichenbachiella agarivorans]|uniref:Bifunctional purine biosynthesis protein PurH n=1 Tax=Reichenbachiella agarivorans TaxID=2979464 RepID=A0ABY6CT15_9BACT|nr:bifunctional phosphoribosylaminoimidazolecarboxamide formyltransferase/IMP cyclohydrolase [Reichenbachiella agarivorans]UXP33633.1 bifunctional phosphoribosylaminoimidazolecarboxamide formyltransferase/IMP cyclohydrolase [Reichenbachiella agarivorans]